MLDEHQAFLCVTEQLTAARRQVIISFSDTRWFWDLFPTVLYWLRQEIQVYCFTLPVAEKEVGLFAERQRRNLMRGMGVQLIENATLPFRGIMLDSATDLTSSALVFTNAHSDYEPIARFYDASTDAFALSAIYDRLSPHLPSKSAKPTCPEIITLSSTTLIDLLKSNVRQYRSANVTISLEQVDVKKILLISRYVRAFRYQQISTIVDAYSQYGRELFSPTAVRLSDGKSSIITPPVLELIGDEYVAIEGNTRSLYCLNNGIHSFQAIVVRGVAEALPGQAVPLKQARITSWKRRPDERIVGLDRSLFRDIERAVRPLEGGQ